MTLKTKTTRTAPSTARPRAMQAAGATAAGKAPPAPTAALARTMQRVRAIPMGRGAGSRARDVRAMHGALGARRTAQLMRAGSDEERMRVQPKLEVEPPNDAYEREADATAQRVMRMAGGACCPSCAQGGECEVRPAPMRRMADDANAGMTVPAELESRIQTMQRGGEPLPDQVRAQMERRFGQDFSDVRIHRDAEAANTAQALDAKAYTLGSHIAFNTSQYAPGTASGDHLLAHELTHVAQQGDTASEPTAQRYSNASRVPRVMPLRRIQLQPEEHQAGIPTPQSLIDRYTSWTGNLDEGALGQRLFELAWMSPRHYDFVIQVIEALSDTDRDDVSLAMVSLARDENLDTFAADADGRRMLDRLYAEMMGGYVASDEEEQGRRIVLAKGRQIPVERFAEAAEQALIFPFRLPGFTVLDDAPIMAERLPNGNIRVKMPVRVLGTSMFRAETRTLPADVFIGGIELPPDQVVGVRLYDKGGQIEFLPALSLVGFSGEATTKVYEKIGEAALIGATFGFGGLAAGGAEVATWGARTVLWLDRAATVLFLASTIINEHRGWILETFPRAGPVFLRAVDIANSIAAVYGMGRLAFQGYRAVVNLRDTWRTWRQEAAAARLSSAQQEVVERINSSTDNLLKSVDEARTSAAGKVPAGVGDRPGAAATAPKEEPSVPGQRPPPPPGTTGGAGGATGQDVLIIGAETADEFAYAREVASRGHRVTAINPERATEAAQSYQAAGGNFRQVKIEDLPREPRFDLIREDYPYPLGRMGPATDRLVAERLARLKTGGRWHVVTEDPDFAATLSSYAQRSGAKVRVNEVPVHHEGVPRSQYPRTKQRFSIIVEK